MFTTKVVLGGKTSNSFQRGTFISSGTLRATQVSKRAGTGVKTNTKKRKHKNALESKHWLLVLILASLVKVYLTKKGHSQLTAVTRKVGQRTLDCYTGHAAHEDTASRSSPA